VSDSIFGTKTPAAPPPPPPPSYVNTRDEIAGTQSNYVTAPDGTKTLVTSQLPLTAEQQAVKDQLDTIAQQNLDYINKLTTNYATSDIPGLQEYLDNYKAQQVEGLNKASADQTQQSETALARFGQADSTAAVQGRAAQGYNYQQGRQTINQNLSAIEQQARQQSIGNATNLFNLATGRQDANLAQLEGSLGQQQGFQLADANNLMNYNTALYNAQLQANALKAQSNASSLGNLASLASLGVLAAGPLGFGAFGAGSGVAGLSTKAGTFFTPAEYAAGYGG
jgi:hypothetical protein